MSPKSNYSDSNPSYRSSRTNNPTLDKFKVLHKNVLNKESSQIVSPSEVVDALKQLAEYLIWEDRNNEDSIFEYFCEENIMDYMTGVLCRSSSRPIRIQLVQTISMLIHNITSKRTLYYFLSNNYINGLIMVPEMYSGGDVSSWTISLLKTLSSILDKSTIKFFFLQKKETFPLLDKSLMFLNNHDSMKRAHVMTIILNIFKVKDDDVIEYIISKSKILLQLVLYLKYCWYRLNKYINKYKRFSENILIECDDTLCFIEELMDLEIEPINEKLIYYTYNICFIPLLKSVLRKTKVDITLLDRVNVPKSIDSEYIINTYHELSEAVGLVDLYINNKTNLYNNFSEPGSVNDNGLVDRSENEHSMEESRFMKEESVSTRDQSRELNVNGSLSMDDENNEDKSENELREESYRKNKDEEELLEGVKEESGLMDKLNGQREINESEGLINNVVYYVVVNILINCKRKDLSKPLLILFFTPFVSRQLLLDLETTTSSLLATETNTPVSTTTTNTTTNANTPASVTSNRMGSREIETKNLFDHVNYEIEEGNVKAYESLVKFLKYYDGITESTSKKENNNWARKDEKITENSFEERELSESKRISEEDQGLEGVKSEDLGETVESDYFIEKEDLKVLENAEKDDEKRFMESEKVVDTDRIEGFNDDCVVNMIMGTFIYDGLASLKYKDSKMLMLLKLLMNKQSHAYELVMESANCTKSNKNGSGTGMEHVLRGNSELLPMTSLLTNNNIYLQMFNVLSANVTNYKLNVVMIKLYNTVLSRYIAHLNGANTEDYMISGSCNIDGDNSINNAGGTCSNEGSNVSNGDVESSIYQNDEGNAKNRKKRLGSCSNGKFLERKRRQMEEELRDELRFHLDIIFNLVRLYILNSIESTTLLYVSIFYDEWVKNVKLYHTSVNNLIQYEDILSPERDTAETIEKNMVSMMNDESAESPNENQVCSKQEKLVKDEQKERLIRRIFFRGSKGVKSNKTISLTAQEGYTDNSPINVFKRYIQVALLFRELYTTIASDGSTSLNDKVHLKPIEDTLSYMYESCPLFYNRLDMLYINGQPIKLGTSFKLDDSLNYFKCTIKNNSEQRQRVYIIHDIFFILAKIKHTHKLTPKKDENQLLKNLSLYSRQYTSEGKAMSHEWDDSESLEKEEGDHGLTLEITCVHLLWNCLVKKVDKMNSKFNLLISWHPNYKSLTPSHYHSNSNNRWNDPIAPVVSEFDVVFSNVRDLNAALKMHNNNKKNLSNMCLLSLQDYLYNSI